MRIYKWKLEMSIEENDDRWYCVRFGYGERGFERRNKIMELLKQKRSIYRIQFSGRYFVRVNYGTILKISEIAHVSSNSDGTFMIFDEEQLNKNYPKIKVAK